MTEESITINCVTKRLIQSLNLDEADTMLHCSFGALDVRFVLHNDGSNDYSNQRGDDHNAEQSENDQCSLPRCPRVPSSFTTTRIIALGT